MREYEIVEVEEKKIDEPLKIKEKEFDFNVDLKAKVELKKKNVFGAVKL